MIDLSRFAGRFSPRPIEPGQIDDLYAFHGVDGGSFEDALHNRITLRNQLRVALLGGRGSGKTSLNNYLVRRLGGTDIVPIEVSKITAPESISKLMQDVRKETVSVAQEGKLGILNSEVVKLLDRSRSVQSVSKNLASLLSQLEDPKHVLLIVDEMDKGPPGRNSSVMSRLHDELSNIDSRLTLLVTMAPYTYHQYIDEGLRKQLLKIEMPRVDRKFIEATIRKRARLDEGTPIEVDQVIDQSALKLLEELSMGNLRRLMYLLGTSLERVRDRGPVDTKTIEEVFNAFVDEASRGYRTANRTQKKVLEAIQKREWDRVAESDRTLSDLIDRLGLVVETLDEPRPFVLTPEFVRVLSMAQNLRRIEGTEIEEIRKGHNLLYLGQKLEGGDPFTLDSSDLNRTISISGGMGKGKTVVLKTIIEEAALLGTNVVAFDTKGDLLEMAFPPLGIDQGKLQHSGFTSNDIEEFAKNVEVVAYSPGTNKIRPLVLDPFALKNPKASEGFELASYFQALAGTLTNLLSIEKRKRESVVTFLQMLFKYASNTEHTSSMKGFADLVKSPPDVLKGVKDEADYVTATIIDSETRVEVDQKLRRLLARAGGSLFGQGDSYMSFLELSRKLPRARIVVVYIPLPDLQPEERDIVIAWTLELFKIFRNQVEGSDREPRLLFCIDEMWKVKKSPEIMAAIDDLVREGRSKGIGCVLTSQKNSDIPRDLRDLVTSRFSHTGQNSFKCDGTQKGTFQSRWLLTRHTGTVRPDEFRSLKSKWEEIVNPSQPSDVSEGNPRQWSSSSCCAGVGP